MTVHAERKPLAWNDFVPLHDDDDPRLRAPGYTRWVSSEYTVTRCELTDGSLWLSLSRYGTRGQVRSWRHLQVIKNILAGPEREAIEIFPAESRLVDTADQYHLWVLPEGQVVPYGFVQRDIGGPTAQALQGGRQTPFEPGTEPPEGPDSIPKAISPAFIGPVPIAGEL